MSLARLKGKLAQVVVAVVDVEFDPHGEVVGDLVSSEDRGSPRQTHTRKAGSGMRDDRRQW